MTTKQEEQLLKAVERTKEIREIKEDVEQNGIHNPYGLRLLEAGEDELRDKLDIKLKEAALEVLEAEYKKQKEVSLKLTEGVDFETLDTKLLGGSNNEQ